MVRKTLRLLLLLAWACASPLARADDDARGRELFENGLLLYEEGQYEAAIVAFQEAYRLSARPGLLYNLANTYERIGRYDEAIDALHRYRALAPADQRESLERRLASLEERKREATAARVLPPPEEPEPPSRGRRAPWALVGAGTGVAAVFGATAGVTYAVGRQHRADVNVDGYEAIRPYNQASVALSGAGAGLAVVGLVGAVSVQGRW